METGVLAVDQMSARSLESSQPQMTSATAALQWVQTANSTLPKRKNRVGEELPSLMKSDEIVLKNSEVFSSHKAILVSAVDPVRHLLPVSEPTLGLLSLSNPGLRLLSAADPATSLRRPRTTRLFAGAQARPLMIYSAAFFHVNLTHC